MKIGAVIKIVGSGWIFLLLVILYVVVLAGATFVEKSLGGVVARAVVYNGWWFYALHGLMVINFVAVSARLGLWRARRWEVMLLHIAFVVILLGAFTTRVAGVEGVVHLRVDQTSSTLYSAAGQPIGALPFELTLQSFTVQHYGGSSAPSDYVTQLSVEGSTHTISMNNPLRYQGWRFYQMSFDADHSDTFLSAVYDQAGTAITYVGYLMLLLGLLTTLLSRGSGLRRAVSTLAIALTVLPVAFADGAGRAEVVDRFSRLIVQSPVGRLQSVGGYADDLVRKISKNLSVEALSAPELLLGVLTDPYRWSTQPILADTTGRLISFVDLLDQNGQYRLAQRVEHIEKTPPSDRNKASKELLKMNERVNIVDNLLIGRMFAIFPCEGTSIWYSSGDRELIADNYASMPKDSLLVAKIWGWFAEQYRQQNYDKAIEILDMISTYQLAKSSHAKQASDRVDAELLYVRLTPFRWGGYLFMTLGLLMVGVVLVVMVGRGGAVWRRCFGALSGISVVVWLFVLFGIVLRWYISARAPLSSSYETMVFVGWTAFLAGLFFIRRSPITFSLAVFLAGVLLFVSSLSWTDPQITPLVPVLNSYWLIAHVAVITSSYSFFGVCFLVGLTTLIMMGAAGQTFAQHIARLTIINSAAATIGLSLLTVGTFLGAVWANQSWGRYWGWDPKETWALITIMVYVLLTHIHLIVGCRQRLKIWFAVGSVVALGSVLMTFFGVNYFLSGMHSYGADSAPPTLWIIFGLYALVVFGVLLVGFCLSGSTDKISDRSDK